MPGANPLAGAGVTPVAQGRDACNIRWTFYKDSSLDMGRRARSDMPKIFISYRRDDSAGQAGRLFDHLGQHFGDDSVFMDVDTIDLGQDFKPALRAAVDKCDLMLVIIGRDWLDCVDTQSGMRRLDMPDDWVSIEIAEALSRGIPVVPVLVQGAGLPATDRLPAALKSLVDRQATVLSDGQWRAGVADLVRRIEAIPRRKEREAVAEWIARLGLRRLVLTSTAAVAMLAAMAWLAWPTQVEMPDVKGKPLTQARAALEAAGLSLPAGNVREEESLSEPIGTVLSQDPSSGLRVPQGEAVRLSIAKTPPPVDLAKHVKIRDTGPEGTIAALAAVTGIEVAHAKEGRITRLSERYLYEKAKHHDEQAGSEGTWFTAIVYVAEQFGAPPYSMWPYRPNEHSPPRGMSWESLDKAAAAYRTRFHRIPGLDGIYAQLRQGHPVIAGTNVGPEWDTEEAMKTGRIQIAAGEKNRRIDGLAAITIVGFDPASGLLRFANGWGKDWGDKGFGTMNMDTAKAVIEPSSLWAMEPIAAP